jgi:ElaB/YqjD/DUF883 family membrane-anchored ribosome-binding protein
MQYGNEQIGKLVGGIRSAMSQLESLLGDSASDAGSKLSKVKSRLGDQFGDAGDGWSEFQEDAADRARTAAYATDDYVRTHTWSTIGAAAAIGVVIGLILNHRR